MKPSRPQRRVSASAEKRRGAANAARRRRFAERQTRHPHFTACIGRPHDVTARQRRSVADEAERPMILPLFRRNRQPDTISSLYGMIVAQARTPVFTRYGVPDTVDGRFDLFAASRARGRAPDARGGGQGLRAGAVRPLLQRHGRQSARDGRRRPVGAQADEAASARPFTAAPRPIRPRLATVATRRWPRRCPQRLRRRGAGAAVPSSGSRPICAVSPRCSIGMRSRSSLPGASCCRTRKPFRPHLSRLAQETDSDG